MRYEWTDELTAKTTPNTPRPARMTTAGAWPAMRPPATRAVTTARINARTPAARPWGAYPPVHRPMSTGATDWIAP